MTDDRYDMRPVGRVDHETVDEMGLEAVLALKRERDALRAEVEHLKQRLEQECRAGCESRAKLKELSRYAEAASWESSERASAYREAP